MKTQLSRKAIISLILELSTVLFAIVTAIVNDMKLFFIAFFLLLFAGVTGLVLSAIARNEIKRDTSLRGYGVAKAGFFLGIGMIIAFLGIWTITGAVSYHRHHAAASVKQNMHRVQLAMEDFAHLSDGQYACAMDDITETNVKFSDLISRELRNPFTKEQTNVKFMPTGTPFPLQHDEVDIPPGEIYVYCDGSKYVILGGGKEGVALSLRLSNF